MSAHSLAGKVALVTGVSRKAGIGAAIARAFAEAGVDALVSRTKLRRGFAASSTARMLIARRS